MPGLKSYTANFKLKVVAFAHAHSKKAAAKEFRVDRKRVQEWCKQREELEKTSKTAKRLPFSVEYTAISSDVWHSAIRLRSN